MKDIILQELTESRNVLDQFLSDSKNLEKIEDAVDIFCKAIENGRKIISCGNGGSHCDAMHFAEELSGKYRADRKALPAMAISDPSHITCVGNDYGYEYIYSRYLEALGQEGDVLLAISTSGNSANIIQAAKTAKEKKITVVALTGKDGGKLASIVDLEIRVPHFGFADRIQEIHIKVIHIFMLLIEKKLGLA
jgi:D-sedoheptulose 7-phosphate isomerase